VKTPRA